MALLGFIPLMSCCGFKYKGEKVKKGQALADGPSTQDGEIALGKNLVVAHMSYEGYNFQHAIILIQPQLLQRVIEH